MRVRQLAWLGSCPGKSKESRYETLSKGNEDSPYLKLPEVAGYAHLVEDLQELGFRSSIGFGSGPITWQELHSWLLLTRKEITTWELFAIRRLSAAYCHQAEISDKEGCPAPFIADVEITPERRKAVDSFWRMLAKRSKAKRENAGK